MIDTSNLSVPASHGKIRAHRLSLRSKRKYAEQRKIVEKGKNLSGGERHYGQPIEPLKGEELRHEMTIALLQANAVEVSFSEKRGVYSESQDLQDAQAVKPKPKKKPKTRTVKESETIKKAPKLTEHPMAAAAKGARPRMGDKCDPLEAFVPSLGKDDKRMPETRKSREDAAKFRAQMDAWYEMKRLAESGEY